MVSQTFYMVVFFFFFFQDVMWKIWVCAVFPQACTDRVHFWLMDWKTLMSEKMYISQRVKRQGKLMRSYSECSPFILWCNISVLMGVDRSDWFGEYEKDRVLWSSVTRSEPSCVHTYGNSQRQSDQRSFIFIFNESCWFWATSTRCGRGHWRDKDEFTEWLGAAARDRRVTWASASPRVILCIYKMQNFSFILVTDLEC